MSDVHLHSHRCEHKTKLLVMNHCQSRMNMWLTDPRGLTKKVNATSSDSSAHCLIGKFGPIKPHISSRIDTTTMLRMKPMAGLVCFLDEDLLRARDLCMFRHNDVRFTRCPCLAPQFRSTACSTDITRRLHIFSLVVARLTL